MTRNAMKDYIYNNLNNVWSKTEKLIAVLDDERKSVLLFCSDKFVIAITVGV